MAFINILYVEDFLPVRLIVKETLELEGWRVEGCDDGLTALSRIESREPYDLLLLDDDLPRARAHSGIADRRRSSCSRPPNAGATRASPE
jgi:CheY-like chemotaxis protein